MKAIIVLTIFSIVLTSNISYEKPTSYYDFSDSEVILLSQLLCGQGGEYGDGEYDFEGQSVPNREEIDKVLYVVMNRVMADGFYSDNVCDVVTQTGAFTVFPKNLNSVPSEDVVRVVREWCDNYSDSQPIPKDHYWFSANGKGGNSTRNHWR